MVNRMNGRIPMNRMSSHKMSSHKLINRAGNRRFAAAAARIMLIALPVTLFLCFTMTVTFAFGALPGENDSVCIIECAG